MPVGGMPSPGQPYGQSLLPPVGGGYQPPPQNGMLAPRPGQPPPGQYAMQGLPSAATPPPFAAPGGYQTPQVRSRTDPHPHPAHTEKSQVPAKGPLSVTMQPASLAVRI